MASNNEGDNNINYKSQCSYWYSSEKFVLDNAFMSYWPQTQLYSPFEFWIAISDNVLQETYFCKYFYVTLITLYIFPNKLKKKNPNIRTYERSDKKKKNHNLIAVV